jgi:hypothetical protein
MDLCAYGTKVMGPGAGADPNRTAADRIGDRDLVPDTRRRGGEVGSTAPGTRRRAATRSLDGLGMTTEEPPKRAAGERRRVSIMAIVR